MKRQQALEAIRESIARGTATPIFEEDRNAAVVRLGKELETALIEPIPIVIGGVAHSDTGLEQALLSDAPLAVAHAGDNWLGYLPSSGEFFLAYGTDASRLNALGFYSTDALAEWRG